jgi:hypothetical protein
MKATRWFMLSKILNLSLLRAGEDPTWLGWYFFLGVYCGAIFKRLYQILWMALEQQTAN